MYLDDPKDKLTTTVRAADKTYHGRTVLCAKCKTMLAVIEKPKVTRDIWQFRLCHGSVKRRKIWTYLHFLKA